MQSERRLGILRCRLAWIAPVARARNANARSIGRCRRSSPASTAARRLTLELALQPERALAKCLGERSLAVIPFERAGGEHAAAGPRGAVDQVGPVVRVGAETARPPAAPRAAPARSRAPGTRARPRRTRRAGAAPWSEVPEHAGLAEPHALAKRPMVTPSKPSWRQGPWPRAGSRCAWRAPPRRCAVRHASHNSERTVAKLATERSVNRAWPLPAQEAWS